MSLPGRPGDPRPVPGHGRPAQDPERVLSQALRAMAGGGKQGGTDNKQVSVAEPRLSVLQILLIATIVGLLVGITAGLISLLN